jgi:hypothetical protein
VPGFKATGGLDHVIAFEAKQEREQFSRVAIVFD